MKLIGGLTLAGLSLLALTLWLKAQIGDIDLTEDYEKHNDYY